MQALFYIGLFGTFFFVASSITVGIAMSTMQEKGNQLKAVAQMFRDVDFAINEIALQEAPSLEFYLGEGGVGGAAPDDVYDEANVSYTARNISWGIDQLQMDPWRSPIEALRIRRYEPLGENVEAAINYFVLASPGPDRQMQTDLTGVINATNVTDAWNEWRDLRSAGPQGDDIIHTFSTRAAVNKIWNQASQVERQIAKTIIHNYQRNVESFQNQAGNALEEIATCALFPEDARKDLQGLDCDAPDIDDLVQECYLVSVYQENPDEIPPPELNILPHADVQVGECWRYAEHLEDAPDYPYLIGDIALYQSTLLIPEDINDAHNLWALVGSDPFTVDDLPVGNIAYGVVGGQPHEMIIRRVNRAELPGWRFTGRQRVIEPE